MIGSIKATLKSQAFGELQDGLHQFNSRALLAIPLFSLTLIQILLADEVLPDEALAELNSLVVLGGFDVSVYEVIVWMILLWMCIPLIFGMSKAVITLRQGSMSKER